MPLAVASALLAQAPARADSPFDGKWKQGALREDYTVQGWLPSGCGPTPVSGSSGGGEIVSVRLEGDELSFVGGGRVYRTNQCYDQLPNLTRDSHSRDPSGRLWRTHCATPPGDPRRAVMSTLVSVTSDTHIDVIETGQYLITLAEGRCVADVKRSRGYDLVVAPAPAPSSAPSPAVVPVPAPTPKEAPRPRATCTPGEPTRLEVRPSRKLMRTGESFTFHAVVMDANGCPTGTPTAWANAPAADPKLIVVDGAGKVTIMADAPEGSTEIVATAAGKSAKVTIDVTSPAHYDDLLARSGLNASGESDAASVAVIGTESIGAGEARAEDGARRRRNVFIGVVAVLAMGLGVAWLLLSKRAKRAAELERAQEARHEERVREAEAMKRERAEKHAAQVRAHEESVLAAKTAEAAARSAKRGKSESAPGAMVCPSCRREYSAASTFCPQDANRLVPLKSDSLSGPAGGICPVCKRGFDPGVKVCPHDKEELVPYALHATMSSASVSPRGKICPTCGDRFEGGASFCGKDGTALVLLN